MLKIINKLFAFSSIFLLVGCSINDPADDPQVTSLNIYTFPDKTTYNAGNSFVKDGLSLNYYTHPLATPTLVQSENITIVDGDNLTAGQSYVTAVYEGTHCEIEIEVSDIFEGEILCVGDSLTQGHYWPTEAYPNFIKDYFEDSSLITINNCGKDGASFKTVGQYNPAYNTTQQYQNSLNGNPTVLTIFLGTNDSIDWDVEKDLYIQDYTDLVNTYRTTYGDDLKIIIITSPKCITNTFGIQGDIICDEIAPLQRQLAEELECELIDANAEFEMWTNADLLRNDGVHLTQKAAKKVAELIADKIKEIYCL